MNHKLFAATICIALVSTCTFAQAEKISGFDAVEALIGQSVKMKNADGTSIYTFISKFELNIKRPKPFNDVVKGRMVQGNGHNQLCFGFGGVAENFCAQVDLENNQLMFIERGAKKTIGKLAAAAKPAKQTTEESDKQFCATFDIILNAVKSGNFDQLKTNNRPSADSMYRMRDAVFNTSVKLGTCVTGVNLLGDQFLECYVSSKAVPAKDAFDAIESQASKCLQGKIKSQMLSNDPAIDEPPTGMEKWAKFDFGNFGDMSIQRGSIRVCDDLFDSENCDTFKGVWVKTTAR